MENAHFSTPKPTLFLHLGVPCDIAAQRPVSAREALGGQSGGREKKSWAGFPAHDPFLLWRFGSAVERD
jgi:hypothetical protein